MPTSILYLTEEKKHSVRYDVKRNGDEPIVCTSMYVSKSVLTQKPYPLMFEVSIKPMTKD